MAITTINVNDAFPLDPAAQGMEVLGLDANGDEKRQSLAGVLAPYETTANVDKKVKAEKDRATTVEEGLDNRLTEVESKQHEDGDKIDALNKEMGDVKGNLTKEIQRATAAEQANANAIQAINGSKGAANGIATLDDAGHVPSSQLPSYVDDILSFSTMTAFPLQGEDGKIYVAKDSNLTYRWDGSGYVEISKSLALGETSSTAYPGNKGKQNAHNIANLIVVSDSDPTDPATDLWGQPTDDPFPEVCPEAPADGIEYVRKNKGWYPTKPHPQYPVENKKVTLIKNGYVETKDPTRILITKYGGENYSYIVLKVFAGAQLVVDINAGSQYGWALYDISQKQYKHSIANGIIKETITVERDGYIAINNSYHAYSVVVESGKFEPTDIMWMEQQSVLAQLAAGPLSGKKIAFLGDSAIDVPGKFWTIKCAEILGAEQRTFAVGSCTWAAQLTSDGSYGNCMAKRVQELKASGFKPDIIVTQMGGNDLYGTLGTKDAVMKPNYKLYAKDTTVYGGIRYNIENILREFPDAILIIGTVFQRMGNKATTVTDALKDMAYEFACPVIDGNSFSGISNRLETITPNYTDSPTGSATPEFPRYNWVEPDGEVVPVDEKTENAVKRYGLYTYDGTHKNKAGEQRMVNFFASQIINYVKY